MIQTTGSRSDAQEAPFATCCDTTGDVEAGCALRRSLFKQPNPAGLLDHEQPPAAIACVGNVHGL